MSFVVVNFSTPPEVTIFGEDSLLDKDMNRGAGGQTAINVDDLCLLRIRNSNLDFYFRDAVAMKKQIVLDLRIMLALSEASKKRDFSSPLKEDGQVVLGFGTVIRKGSSLFIPTLTKNGHLTLGLRSLEEEVTKEIGNIYWAYFWRKIAFKL